MMKSSLHQKMNIEYRTMKSRFGSASPCLADGGTPSLPCLGVSVSPRPRISHGATAYQSRATNRNSEMTEPPAKPLPFVVRYLTTNGNSTRYSCKSPFALSEVSLAFAWQGVKQETVLTMCVLFLESYLQTIIPVRPEQFSLRPQRSPRIKVNFSSLMSIAAVR